MFYLSTPWLDILEHVDVSAQRYFGTMVILCQKHQAETSQCQVSLFRNEPKYLGAKVSQCQNIHRDKISTSWKVCRAERYSDVSIKNIDILPNRQYIANTADSAQEQYS